MAIEMLVLSQWDIQTEKWQSSRRILDDLMAWITFQVHGGNAKAGSTMRTSSCPVSTQSLIAMGRRPTVVPPLPFCWVQIKKGTIKWGDHQASEAIMQDEMDWEEEQLCVSAGFPHSLNKGLKVTLCRESPKWAGNVKPKRRLTDFTEFLPLFKNWISTFGISPPSSSSLL